MIELLSEYRYQNKSGKARLILPFIIIFLFTFGLIIQFVSTCLPNNKNDNPVYANLDPFYPWYGCLHYLTYQNALIMIVFFILWIINFFKHFKFMRTNTFLISACSYSALVFILFNVLLLPGQATNKALHDYYSLGEAWWWVVNVCIHMIGPAFCIAFFILNLFSKQQVSIKEQKITKSILIGSIYPIVYLTYLVLLFFIAHRSVYGATTAMWNFNDIIDSGSNKVPPGSAVKIYVPVAGILLAESILWLFSFLNKKFVVNRIDA